MLHLHGLISTCPEVVGKIRYNIPFYFRKSWVCYLNPLKNGGVELAFPRGNELSNEQGILMANERKQVRGIVFKKAEDIPDETILEILAEAMMLDEEVKYDSKRIKNKEQREKNKEKREGLDGNLFSKIYFQ